jgi:hypothetical protein
MSINKKNQNNKNNSTKYQISGMMGNYTYDSDQNLPFDPTSISSSGHSSNSGLSESVINQQMFVNDYNNFKPTSTFQTPPNNSSKYQNMNDHSQSDIKDAFVQNKPILDMLPNKYMNDTLYSNMNEDLLKETIRENKIHINSIDRSVEMYPDPFNYVVTFGPIVNSGINYTDKSKNQNKFQIKEKVNNEIGLAYEEINNSNFVFDSQEMIKEYVLEIQNKNNPYINRTFERVKYFRIDVSVLPRFNSVAINNEWNYCDIKKKKTFIKDDYERMKYAHFPKFRYIPDDTDISPLGGQFVQVVINEVQSNSSFGTNNISDKSYLLILDKVIGALYIKYNPYAATKNFRDPYPGNVSKLTIQFYDSSGNKIKLETDSIDYETNQIKKTKLVDPELYDLNNEIDGLCMIDNPKIYEWFVEKYNDVIKSFVVLNFDIYKLIPFYLNIKFDDDGDILQRTQEEKNCDDTYCIKNYSEIILNQENFTVCNIFDELNEFVTLDGFVKVYKTTNSGKKIKISIDAYINDIIWYNNKDKYCDVIKYNLNAIDENYKNFGFSLLDRLKTEINSIPSKEWLQNYIVCVLGIYSNDLNTKIEYGNG